MEQQQQPIQIKAENSVLKGVYLNMMEAKSNKEEFCLDFYNIFPPIGVLTSRIVISPGHLKRMIKALQNSLDSYEKSFGKIEAAVEPEKSGLGFQMK